MIELPTFKDLSQRNGKIDLVPELDGLRGVAVLFVLASHTSAFFLHRQGGVGVWIFFALSGFLLSQPFVLDPNRYASPRALGCYFLNRLKRIVPLYYACVVVVWLSFERSSSWFLQHLSFVDSEYHLWSIRQEMIFYLFLPLVMYFYRRTWNHPRRFVILLTIAAVVLEQAFYYSFRYFKFPWSAEPLYPAGFLIGIIAAVCRHRLRVQLWKHAGIVVLILFYLSNYAFTTRLFGYLGIAHPPTSLGWAYPTPYFFLSGILLLGCFAGSVSLNRILGNRLLRSIGLIGYSFYLWHWYVLGVVVRYFGEPVTFIDGGILFFVVGAGTYVVATLSYLLIERPLNQVRCK